MVTGASSCEAIIWPRQLQSLPPMASISSKKMMHAFFVRAISNSSLTIRAPCKQQQMGLITLLEAEKVLPLSQRGDSPFVYRDRGGWPASLPYIRKIRVSVAIGNQSRICLHERVPMVKIWGSSKNDQNWTTGKLLNL